MWVFFNDELVVRSLYKRQADLERNNIRLIKYIPPWIYERNKQLEIYCRMERDKNLNLLTQIRLGKSDLKLFSKMKGERFYKPLPVEYFGKLPSLNFIRDTVVSPGSPKGRPRYSSEESVRGGHRSCSQG